MKEPFSRLVSDISPVSKRLRLKGKNGKKRKSHQKLKTFDGLILFGGVDGTRTRDPRRDRPVF
ncbi:MAG: hypothetical protein U1D25_12405, partial [Hydrogenophaga sp.]|uniref:hypothetical protein n=1 Tax=Hydrogenophaga sp. TaxID=1904254 RepID=UPI002ABA7C89